ncbi:hypothetical protein H0H92_001886, partial [Tricholoma furcatifolium]
MTRRFSYVYEGDLGWVYSANPEQTPEILLLPRFHRSLSHDQKDPEKDKTEKGKRRRKPRAPQGELSFNEAVRLFGRKKL